MKWKCEHLQLTDSRASCLCWGSSCDPLKSSRTAAGRTDHQLVLTQHLDSSGQRQSVLMRAGISSTSVSPDIWCVSYILDGFSSWKRNYTTLHLRSLCLWLQHTTQLKIQSVQCSEETHIQVVWMVFLKWRSVFTQCSDVLKEFLSTVAELLKRFRTESRVTCSCQKLRRIRNKQWIYIKKTNVPQLKPLRLWLAWRFRFLAFWWEG